MADQLQFVALDFFNLHSHSQTDDIHDIPDLPQFHSTPSYSSSMEPENFSSMQIFIEDSISTQSSQNSEKSSKNEPKSILHNMQKHFFTFIQYLTPKTAYLIESLQESDSELLKCFQELLKLIKTQRRKTKEELVPIFGEFDEKKIARSNSIYNGLIKKFSVEILKSCLAQLKEHYLSEIKSENSIEDYLKNSKMGRKSEFKRYIERFIVEVETNSFKFRLTKASQESIRTLVKQEKKSEEWEVFLN